MHNRKITLVTMVIFVCLQIWFLSITLQHPYIGIALSQDADRDWIVDRIGLDGAAQMAKIKAGDQILKIDGNRPELIPSVKKWRTVEQARHLTVIRDGKSFDVELNEKIKINFDIVPLVEEGICLALAVCIGISMRYSSSARLLAILFFTGSLIYMCQGASARGDTLAKIAITTLMTAMPIIFLHFLIVFFKEKGMIQLPRNILRYLYVFLFFTAAARCLLFVPEWAYPAYRSNETVTLGLFISGFLYNVILLGYLYFKYGKAKSYVSSIIKSIWSSLFISFLPVLCLSFIPQLVLGSPLVDAVYTSWFILVFPVSFSYLIASNQLYDIGLVLQRFLFAGMFSIVPSGLFAGLYAVIFRDQSTIAEICFLFIVCLILMTIVLYSAEYFTTRLESLLFPKKYMLRSSLRKIAKNLGTISSMRELADIILADIVSTLEVKGGAIAFRYQDNTEIIQVGEMNEALTRLIIQSSGEEAALAGYTVMEINRHEEFTSYLLMNRKKTNTLLGKEELNWLGLIISYLEVSLENVHLIRKLKSKLEHLASHIPDVESARDFQWFRKITFELQEEERNRIAADLHDTTMQDLFFLKGRLGTLMQKYAYSEEDKKQLNNLMEFVDLINAGLRHTCFELNPHLLVESGLVNTVHKLLENESFHAPFRIDFDTGAGAGAIENKDIMAKRHLLRIIQELLNNAKKHSHASHVRFGMSVVRQQFRLTYEDDGVGFRSFRDRNADSGTSGIGMIQMKGRVLLLRGQMEVDSNLDSGTRITITIPIQEAAAG